LDPWKRSRFNRQKSQLSSCSFWLSSRALHFIFIFILIFNYYEFIKWNQLFFMLEHFPFKIVIYYTNFIFIYLVLVLLYRKGFYFLFDCQFTAFAGGQYPNIFNKIQNFMHSTGSIFHY
jgi:hypothetical protein